MNAKRLNYFGIVVFVFLLIGCDGHSSSSSPLPIQTALNNPLITQQPGAIPFVTEQITATFNSSRLLTYRGATGYTGTREYAIDYDTEQWQLLYDYEPNFNSIYDNSLQNRQDPRCYIVLYGGPMQMKMTGSTELAGRRWNLAAFEGVVDTKPPKKLSFITYITFANDPVGGNISYYLTVYLPVVDDPAVKSHCQQQAEAVISTFRILDSVQK